MQAHHIAVYNGKRVEINYVSDPKREFKVACQRIVDNGFSGHGQKPDGKIYDVSPAFKTARLRADSLQLDSRTQVIIPADIL